MTTKSCPDELRERIVACRQEGNSAQEVSKWFKVSKRSVERYWNAYLQTGTAQPKQRGGYKKSRLAGHERTLEIWLKEKPDLTLKELEVKCREDLGVEIKQTALWHQLHKMNLSFKKNATRQRTRS